MGHAKVGAPLLRVQKPFRSNWIARPRVITGDHLGVSPSVRVRCSKERPFVEEGSGRTWDAHQPFVNLEKVERSAWSRVISL